MTHNRYFVEASGWGWAHDVRGIRSHKMKQTQNTRVILAGEEVVAYSLVRGKAAAVTREGGEVAACSLPQDKEKTPEPLLSRSSCLQLGLA